MRTVCAIFGPYAIIAPRAGLVIRSSVASTIGEIGRRVGDAPLAGRLLQFPKVEVAGSNPVLSDDPRAFSACERFIAEASQTRPTSRVPS